MKIELLKFNFIKSDFKNTIELGLYQEYAASWTRVGEVCFLLRHFPYTVKKKIYISSNVWSSQERFIKVWKKWNYEPDKHEYWLKEIYDNWRRRIYLQSIK